MGRLFGGSDRDDLVAALRDEIASLRATQGILLAQVGDLTNKLSAHADAKAHAAATFQQRPPREPDARGRAVHYPPGVADLTSSGRLQLGQVRKRNEPIRPSVRLPPPATD